MHELTRRGRLLRDLEEEFVPDYDALSLPAADKRAAYALEHIAFRVGRMERSLARIADALEAVLSKDTWSEDATAADAAKPAAA